MYVWNYTARDVRSRSRYVTAFRREGESWARTILGSRARTHTARGLLMSASQSGNFSTSHRVMHEPRGGEQAILPDQSKWARHGNCRTLGGASIWKPFPSNGRSSARLKILDRDPRPLGIKDVPVGIGEDAKFRRKFSSLNACEEIVKPHLRRQDISPWLLFGVLRRVFNAFTSA